MFFVSAVQFFNGRPKITDIQKINSSRVWRPAYSVPTTRILVQDLRDAKIVLEKLVLADLGFAARSLGLVTIQKQMFLIIFNFYISFIIDIF